MSGVVISSEQHSPNTGRATRLSAFAADPIMQSTLINQTRSRRSPLVNSSVSSDMRTSNHEQPSVKTSSNLPTVDMAADKAIETTRTTEIVISDAVCAESGSASLPHFFNDAAYGVLPPPSVVSGDER